MTLSSAVYHRTSWGRPLTVTVIHDPAAHREDVKGLLLDAAKTLIPPGTPSYRHWIIDPFDATFLFGV